MSRFKGLKKLQSAVLLTPIGQPMNPEETE